MTRRFDIAVIGAGMAGASIAAEIAPHASVLILEGEDQPGYHATGRSAAFWSETYGGPWVQPLTSASRPFLERPEPDFAERGFLAPRGAIHLADASGTAALDRLVADFAEADIDLRPLGRLDLIQLLPTLRAGWDRAVFEPSCADIDVAALHGAYLRRARRDGAELVTDARVTGIAREGKGWLLDTPRGSFAADILVNAAGAWADEVAAGCGVPPIGLQPMRRTVVQLRVGRGGLRDLPLVTDLHASFYFKGEGERSVWVSPLDETPVEPCDAAPEEIDVATAIDRFERAVDWPVEAVERKWAGLRTFAPDRQLKLGFDPLAEGFFWCAGQGGMGIQTAPAASLLGAALIRGEALPEELAGIDAADFAPRPRR